MEILGFLKEVSFVSEVSINGGVVFFWLKITFYTKALVFGQMSEFLTKVIKSCCADFEEK